MAEVEGRPTGPRLILAAAAGVAALAVGQVSLGVALYDGPPPMWLLSGFLGGLFFAVAGVVVWRVRPGSRTGPLMVGFAVLQMLRQVVLPADTLAGELWALALVVPVILLGPVLVGWLLLGFPSGRLPGRAERIVVRTGFALVLVATVALTLTYTPVPWLCGDLCAPSRFAVAQSLPLFFAVRIVVRVGFIALALAVVVLLVRQARRWTPRQRRSRVVVLVAGCLAAAGYVASEAVALAGYARWLPPGLSVPLEHLALWSVALALPAALLFAILRERLAVGSVGALLVQLERAPAEQIEPLLARALRDPELRVAFPTPTGLVDSQGAVVQPRPDQELTPLGDPPVAEVIHDPSVAEHRALLDAAASATRLALENARLQAELRARLSEVRASRLRIVAAADQARRQVERDLHDGAQQRLLGVGLALQVLEQEIPRRGPAAALLEDVREELSTAVRELRRLAAGIYPAVLTDQGLRPALDALAANCPLPAEVTGGDPGRLPTTVETTAYFCASEAVANVVKHAGASRILIRLDEEPDRLLLTVADDGVGGARREGAGLRGLADRLATVEGRLTVDSPPGGGTRFRAELPRGWP
ncbi:sensor histidine kinase [Geodermatophilus sp. SYSU D00691]